MFWTDIGQTPKMERATLSGTQRVVMVTSNLVRPYGIDLDRGNRLVFWVDATLERVESVDYHGNNRKLLFQSEPQRLPNFSFNGVTFITPYLFVSEWASNRVLKFSATNANGTVISNVKIPQVSQLGGIIAYDSLRQLPGTYTIDIL